VGIPEDIMSKPQKPTIPAVIQSNSPAERQAQPIGTIDDKIHDTAVVIFKRYGKMLVTLIGGDKAAQDRWMATMKYLFRSNPDLVQKCDHESLGLSIVRAASLGLDLNPLLGQAWIIPRWNSKANRNEAVLQVGYRGAIMLMYRGNTIASASATVVYKGEPWKWTAGTHEDLMHEPDDDLRTNSLDDIVAAYAVVWMRGSDRPIFKVVQRRKLLKASTMSGSKGAISNTWRDHPEEMAAKTALFAVAKRIPGVDGNRDLTLLAEIEGQHALGKDPEPPPMEGIEPTRPARRTIQEALAAAQPDVEPEPEQATTYERDAGDDPDGTAIDDIDSVLFGGASQ
jgi:phage RecT family recombinase